MISKWDVWDFFKNNPSIVDRSFLGNVTIQTISPYITQMIKSRLPEEITKNMRVVIGSELSVSWVEENFQTLSFFGGTENFFVHQADKIPKDVIAKFVELGEITDRVVIFIFEKKSTLQDKLSKFSGNHIKINTPPFWEMLKMLDFISSTQNVLLSYPAKQYILSNIENDIDNFVSTITVISLHYPNKVNLSVDDIKDLLSSNRLDRFALASAFSDKKFRQFYSVLAQREFEYDELRSFFSFMKTHIQKLIDPSYSKKGRSPSKYDKEMMSKSSQWNKEELLPLLVQFSDFEVRAKRKDPLLTPEIRRKYYESFTLTSF